MAITKTVKYSGNKVSSSNDGKLVMDQTAGEIIVRDGDNTRRYYLGSDKSPTGFGQYISKPSVDVLQELADAKSQ